ncbi:alginate lyase family protein [Halobacillus litoralis]|uniref:alginate lyase family protein n=1 Tax=Halobacillus litoralis TaxID=45668 RepID=UPI001CFD7B6A|nr:alginate lyase family protein [Halobacillus litoralis]WLR49089.1 alginate lyase family protein [Halobacillus litoralis]
MSTFSEEKRTNKSTDVRRFFYSRGDRNEIKNLTLQYWKGEADEVIERARLASENTFVFTHRWDMERCETPVTFPNEIDWTFQFQDDFEWTVNLNRARFMAELGQAYWLTGEESFASHYIRLMKDWIRQNPLSEEEILESRSRHYNVKDTWRKLDSGIRICNWIKGYFCVRESEIWGEAEEELFKEALALHGHYLSIAYTPHDQQSNWGFLETNGLFQIALLFPHIEGSAQWMELALERMGVMCQLQVFEDGMHNEQSPMYHHEVLHCLFETVLLARKNQWSIPDIMEDTLNRMFTASLSFVKPSGYQPMTSDSDHTDIRDVLSRGALLNERSDLKHQGYDVLDFEGIWYYGKNGFDVYEELEATEPDFCSTHLEQSGYSIMRNGWSPDDHYLLFDGGHMDMIRAHGHDDFLHYDLVVHGSDMIIDPGRYTYKENEHRQYFKESFQHNTCSVDDCSISTYLDSWHWEDVAQPLNRYWRGDKEYDYVQSGHDGYMRLEDPVQVMRQILFVKPHYWLLVDSFKSKHVHDFAQHFHFAEHAALTNDSSKRKIQVKGGEGGHLDMTYLQNVSLTQEDCWISRDYNQKLKSTKVVARQKGSGQTTFVTVLNPYRDDEHPDMEIHEVDVYNTRSEKMSKGEVTAFEVKRGEESEVVLFSHDGPKSFQFEETQMTGEVLLIKRSCDGEERFIIKV